MSAKFTMLGYDAMGSVAEMPIVADYIDDAITSANIWLATYDHGLTHAIVIDTDSFDRDMPVDKIIQFIDFSIEHGHRIDNLCTTPYPLPYL